MSNTKILAVIAFVITFLLGGVSGYMMAPVESAEETEQKDSSDSEEEKEKLTYEEFQAKMIEDLNLSEDQQDPIFDKIRENRKANREVVNKHRENMRDELAENYELFLDDLSEILDSQQFESFEEYYGRDALRKRRRE